MTNISGWITFKELIDSILLAQGDPADTGQFMRYLNFAIKGYEDLRLRSLPATKPVYLDVNGEMNIVVLPNDFLKFVSVGTVHDGKFYAFKPKSDMLTSMTPECGVDNRDVTAVTSDTVYFTAYYTVDMENRRIILDVPTAVTQVLLNYTPTGIRMDGVTYIPRMARMVIEAYVEWQAAMRDKNTNMSEKIMYQNEYLKELMKFRGLQYNVDELFNEYYELQLTGKQY